MANALPSLFHEIVFHIVSSDKFPQEKITKVRDLLLSNGATEATPWKPSATTRVTIDLEEVTHIIAATSDFPGYSDAERVMTPVVKPEWVIYSLNKSKLAHVRPFTPDPRYFFSDVMATVAELPEGDKEAICGGIIAMGGQYSNHLTKLTTHIVALNLDNKKCLQAQSKKLNVKIVLPHWFDDCLKLNRRIAEGPYMLPNPEIERLDSAAHVDIPVSLDLSYTHAHTGGPMNKDPPKPPREGFNIFEEKRVMLGEDLQLSERLRKILIGIIEQTKGKSVSNVEEADVYIGQFREGDDYVTASRRHAHVGSLTWLYWMFAHGEWTNPTNRLLHYPLVKGGIPGMVDKIITVSNYGGDARLYLENLIEACGATFTKSMKIENTHLITARAHSEKCTAAREWNINMVNHLWLEDTYAKWKVMTMTDPRYTHFPKRTNLQEIVGQTRIDLNAIVPFYKSEPGLSLEAPNPIGGAMGVNGVSKSITSRLAAANLSTPVSAKRHKTQEEESPAPPSTGRKAKEKASARLHDTIMPDVVQYQKELKRKGGIMGGRSRAESHDGIEERLSVKRSKSRDSGDEKAAKKSKKRPPKPTIFLLITAYTGWLDTPNKEDEEKKTLAELGIKCVEEPSQCTYLAAPQLVRTEKFCCALARAPIIVNTQWVETCIREERLVDTAPYVLKDPDGEKRLGVNLATSLARAKENKGRLLEGQAVLCTGGVHGGYEVCRKIIEANGGLCVMFKSQKKLTNVPDSDRLVLLSGDGPNDRKLWPRFQAIAQASEKESEIYRSDWLLEMAMNQQVLWSDRYNVETVR